MFGWAELWGVSMAAMMGRWFSMESHRPRSELRAMFTTEQRMKLGEDDLDNLDATLQLMNARISKLLVTATGILISTITMLVMLVANLLVARG